MYKDGKWSGWRGRLAVTDRRVWFEAHVLGLFGTEQEIAFDDIEIVELRKTLGFMPNDPFIRTKNGQTFDFVTGGRRQLRDIITSHMPQA